MSRIDVFNGDADGICALHQLRLHSPCDSQLVTGVKRDINLLRKVKAVAADQVTVLDISLDKNREGLLNLLSQQVQVQYFDHHFAGDIPDDPYLDAHINTAADVCTGLLVNGYLKGAFLPWAVTAAFGDNLFDSARLAAASLNLSEPQLELLKELGTLINYNGYGASLDDLYFEPDQLYLKIKPYRDPFAFIHESDAFNVLQQGYAADMAQAIHVKAEVEQDAFAVYVLPDEKWSRRVSGVYANDLAQQTPSRAHAILSAQSDGSFVVSVRAPLANREGADEVCRQFETGGGRKAAAGINSLQPADYDRFVTVMSEVF